MLIGTHNDNLLLKIIIELFKFFAVKLKSNKQLIGINKKTQESNFGSNSIKNGQIA